MTGPRDGAHATVDAPAKLNLGLRILGRRDDGYHLLESLFVPLNWCDRVEVAVESGEADHVSFELLQDGTGEVPADASNLAVRAASAWLSKASWRGRVRVRLHKSLPAAAGLGGGSSDAGAVLRALEQLLPGALPAGVLTSIALSLGADVPFFLDPRPSLVTGIGERIEPIEGLPGLWIALANPGISLATAAVYGAWDASPAALTPVEAGSTMRALSRFRESSVLSPEHLSALLINDLEPAACGLCPGRGRGMEELKRRLRSLGAAAIGMSGSGATIFGVYADEASANRAADRVIRSMGSMDGAEFASDDSGGVELRESEGFNALPGAWARVVRSAGSERKRV